MPAATFQKWLWLPLVPALLLGMAPGAAAQSGFRVTKGFIWSQPGHEIERPRFSADGTLVVFVTRVHWPDGHEAEELPESYLQGFEERKKNEPRFADPVIRLLDAKGASVCTVEYGWNPSLSPDNKRILFARQVKPITGLRPLAETLAGNDIQLFDCETRRMTPVATPASGYLDAPVFFPDASTVVYTLNDAVNGAMGGPVGLAEVHLPDQRMTTLLARQDTPAVPCPPPRTGTQKTQFLCAQVPGRTSSFPGLLFDFAPVGGRLLALVGTPLPAAGDMYVAENYDLNLLALLPARATVLALGKKGMADLEVTSFQSASEEHILMFSPHWRALSLASGEWLPDVGPKNTNKASFYSPDLKYYLAMEPGEEPDHFVLYRTRDGRRLLTFPRSAAVYAAAWSPDSRRFALVLTPKGATGRAYRDELAVYSIP